MRSAFTSTKNNNYNISRGPHVSLRLFSNTSSVRIEQKFGNINSFWGGGKLQVPKDDPKEKSDFHQQSQSAYRRRAGMKPGPDHREASALTTSPFLTRVVQKVSNAIHRINRYAVDSVVCFVSTCPHDSDLSCG